MGTGGGIPSFTLMSHTKRAWHVFPEAGTQGPGESSGASIREEGGEGRGGLCMGGWTLHTEEVSWGRCGSGELTCSPSNTCTTEPSEKGRSLQGIPLMMQREKLNPEPLVECLSSVTQLMAGL